MDETDRGAARSHPDLTRGWPPGRYVPDVPGKRGRDRGTSGRSGVQVEAARGASAHREADVSAVGHDLGPLSALLDDDVTDVFVNGGAGTWVDRGAGARPDPRVHLSEGDVRSLAARLVARGGRHVDEATPCVDVRLPGGVRVHAVLPPVSTRGTLLSVRLPRPEPLGLDELAAAGFFAPGDHAVVRGLVERRANVLVTGAGGAGKTTFLAAFLSAADPGDRVVLIEDVAELRLRHPHVVSLEARQPNLEGVGGIDTARLLREALRMRPDRLVVGECRGVEVRDLLSALNTGHDGGAGTLHANGLADVPARLEALGAVAGLAPSALARQAVSAVDAVLHVERRDGGRRLAQIGSLALGPSGELVARAGLRAAEEP
ncbi:TadA family conjugal transfer-associated ATPase [Frigoribacterium sp. NBH87]|uniref:TadA family conjugal transfer-associated ATPase n=1 Tax=Frigoribacterium sp. CFBP 13707 TaxID=2775313 RepID=UPI0016287D33|nr:MULTISPECIES: TadA family conjugal transfer-associated ATPase [unclassified Frigoribacterium]MBD8727224.1 TadA family conjugal transfer-associated ATPase [Frigoribacterium sp. CFBP 13707]QNE44739.1 TadA family conjugal transfer-associated ATPase [Frigoribacterium sp. NBH87]